LGSKILIMKRLLLFIFLVVDLFASAQTKPSYFTPVATSYDWNWGRFKYGFRPPIDTLPTADSGSIAYKNGVWYGKTNYWFALGGLGGSADSSLFATRFWANSHFQPIGSYVTTSFLSTNHYTKTQINSFFGGTTTISGYNKPNWDAVYASWAAVQGLSPAGWATQSALVDTAAALRAIAGSGGTGDMTKAVYDPGNNGVVDNSEGLEGHAAAYFVPASRSLIWLGTTYDFSANRTLPTPSWQQTLAVNNVATSSMIINNSTGLYIAKNLDTQASLGTVTDGTNYGGLLSLYEIAPGGTAFRVNVKTVGDITADRDQLLQNKGGTLALLSDITDSIAAHGGGGTISQTDKQVVVGTGSSVTSYQDLKYQDSLAKLTVGVDRSLSGSIVTIGNSITYGLYADTITNGYASLLAKYHNAHIVNLGESGAVIDYIITNWSLIPQYADSIKYITLMWGTNEAITSYDTATYRLRWNKIIDSLQSDKGYPQNKIVILGSPYLLPTYDIRPYAFIDSSVAAIKGVRFVENYRFMVESGKDSLMYSDIIHPNTTGHAVLWSHIVNALGDSLTGNGNFRNNVNVNNTVNAKQVITTIINTVASKGYMATFGIGNFTHAYIDDLHVKVVEDSLNFFNVTSAKNRILLYDGGVSTDRSVFGISASGKTIITGLSGQEILFGLGKDAYDLTSSNASVIINSNGLTAQSGSPHLNIKDNTGGNSHEFSWQVGGGSLNYHTLGLIDITNSATRMEVNSSGKFKYNAYGSGAFTGTLAYLSGYDASGNVIEINPATVAGGLTGTPGRIALFDQSTGAVTDDADLTWTTSRVNFRKDTLTAGPTSNNLKIIRVAVPPITSYANTGGTGNRSSSITVTTTLGTGGADGSIGILVDGDLTAGAGTYFSGEAVSGKIIKFDFGSGQSKVADTLRWKQQDASGQGTWKPQGSTDNSTWDDLGSNQTLGGATTSYIAMSPTGGYRYYRLLGVSGSTSNSPYLYEAEFKIADASAGSSEMKAQTFKSGVASGELQLQPDGGTVKIGSTPIGSSGDSVLVKYSDGTIKAVAQSSVSSTSPIQILSSQYTNVGNSGTSETDLMSNTISGGQLASDGDWIEIDGSFTYAANANTKSFKFKFGSYVATISSGFVTSSGGDVLFHAKIIRTGATSQKITLKFDPNNGTKVVFANASATETLASNVVLKFTGQSDTASNDITQNSMSIVYYHYTP
jgi:hypothetical protein